jgi:5-methylcytosine-specific restriction protein A
MPTSDDFRGALRSQLRAAELKGLPFIDVNAGELHRHLGGYPGKDHHMPTCCQVMEQERRALDSVVAAPPRGKGASLTVRYRLPR